MERLVAWYQVGSSYAAVAALIIANLVPLVGVLWFGWDVWAILIIYWLENGIVGLFNVLKMRRAEGSEDGSPMAAAETRRRLNSFTINGRSPSGSEKAVLIPFFIMHYGIFWVVHGIFVLTLPLFAFTGADGAPDFGTTLDPLRDPPSSWSCLFISHGAVVSPELHRPWRIPADDRGPADVRALRSAGHPPRHDHLRRDPDRGDRGPGGGDRRAGAAQDRSRSRAPPGRAPGAEALPWPPRRLAARGDRSARGRSSASCATRASSASSRPSRARLAGRRGDLGRGARLRAGRGRGDLERRSGATSSSAGRRPTASPISTARPISRTATRSTTTGGSSPASTACGGSRATSADGTRTAVVDRYEGQRLNSPNDLVVASDGAIWFTDPPYGILDDGEGYRADSELGGCFVFRLDRSTGELTSVTDALDPPQRAGVLARRADALRLRYVDRAGRGRQPPHRGLRRRRRAPARRPAGLQGHRAGRLGRACASTSRATSGPRPATGSTSSTRPPSSSGGSSSRRRPATAPSAVLTAGGCSSPPPRRCGRSRSGSAALSRPGWMRHRRAA